MNAIQSSPATSAPPWLWPVTLILGTLAGAAIPELFARGYYHYDDNMHLFLPTFYEIGTQLRMGHMPWISDRTWLGGNFLGEGQFALFNPFSLALYAWMLTVPETAVAAFVFATFHLLVLAIGVYLLVTNLGGRAAYAAAAGVAAANTSIVSYWYAAAWWNALVADAWLLVALAFWAKFMMRGKGLLPAVLFGALSMVSGWPHGWIALGIFIAIFAFVAWRQGDSPRALIILGGGIATLMISAPAIAPVVDYALLSERRSQVGNSGDMVGTFEALLSLSWPTYLPQVHRIYGWIAEAPLTFAAWFVAPILLACRHMLWQRRREPALAITGIAAIVFFALSLGPEYFFFLRWPMRFISYYQIVLIVLTVLLLSHSGATEEFSRSRGVLGTYAALMTYLALASDPHEPARQALFALLGMLFLIGLARYARRPDFIRLAIHLLATTLILVSAIHYMWPRHPNVPDWSGPSRVAAASGQRTAPFSGNTLLLHNWSERRLQDKGAHLVAALESDSSMPSGALALWSIPRTINGYSAIPHGGLKKKLCFNVWGHSCQKAASSLFEIPDGLTLRRDELLNLTEIRVKKERYTPAAVAWPPEWQLAETSDGALIYRRTQPLQHPGGSLAWVQDGLGVKAEGTATMNAEALRVENSSDEPRRLIFSRLFYPGFSFALDGKALPVEVADQIFLAVTIPPRGSGRLVLDYTPALLKFTSILALAGLLLASALARRYRSA